MEELFDVCDPAGLPTGQRLPRSVVHRQGLWHRSAHLWIVNSQQQILLQRRHPSKQTDPGKWDISVAGHLSAGQTPLQAVLRETEEELGLRLSPQEVHFLLDVKKEYSDPNGQWLDREYQSLFVCRKEVELSQLVLQADEVTAVAWQDLQRFAQRLEAADSDLVGRPGEYAEAFRFFGINR